MPRLLNRQDTIAALTERDGYRCTFPGCVLPFDSGTHSVTIDHIYPQSRGRAEGWTEEQINDLSNLQLQGKKCNAKKGHLVYNEDGTLPIKVADKAAAKVDRPEICDTCYSGRLLFPGEECYDCGSGPQPAKWPRSLQRRPKECDHSTYHCFMCVAYDPDLRVSATMRLITGP